MYSTVRENDGVGRRTTVPAATGSDRIFALDVLRGIAILGTLATNTWLFTSGLPGTGQPDRLGTFSNWLPNGKFLGLLTIMFGIGLEIQRQAALRAGKRWPGKYPWRAALLFLDGFLNYIFVVQFDVLRAYAVVGLLVAFLLLTSEKVQWWLIGAFLTAHLGWMTWQAVGGARETLAQGLPSAPDLGSTTSYWDSVMANASGLGSGFGPGSEFFTILLMGAGLFLVGAKLYRRGIFTDAKRRLRWWLIAIGFGVALPLDHLLSQTEVFPAELSGFARYGTAPVVALGILASVAEFYHRRGKIGLPGRLLSCVGRMALSCYLLQNVLGVLAQYTVLRMPVFEQLGNTLTTYLAYALISATLIVFSWLWLRRFSRGPFELAWNWGYRKLARE
ncbi:DUF418 domain-containing protein [Lentzea sp. NPDC004782]|uniref:DUF418 domain-containing protein n=1 Tax=Lentzea sp. NPDC004782 TaxID=3154458 RepID=UPI0033BA29C9